MPTFDFSLVIKKTDGTDGIKNDKPFTAKDAFEEALVSDYSETPGRPPPPDVRAKRFKLWRKMTRSRNENGKIELTLKEAETLHECAAAFPTITYGQLLEILDGPGDDDGGGGPAPASKPN